MATNQPFGTWVSPITAEYITQTSVTLGALTFGSTSKSLFWLEGRSSEGGRNVLCRYSPNSDGTQSGGAAAVDVTPKESNVRTRVHEYGGAAFLITNDAQNNEEVVIYSNFSDQRLYKTSTSRNGAEFPQVTALTPENDFFPKDCLYRFADAVMDVKGNRIIAIREDHTDPNPAGVVNCLVALTLDGSGSVEILASGNDFYASPRLSPCGTKLAYITWNHPNMPWDSTELVVMNLNKQKEEGEKGQSSQFVVAGREGVSVMQPLWNPKTSELFYVSDEKNGYWIIHKVQGSSEPADATWSEKTCVVYEKEADFSGSSPGWRLGQQGFTFFEDGCLVTSYSAIVEAPSSTPSDAVPMEASTSILVNQSESATTATKQSVLVVIEANGVDVKEYDQTNGLPQSFGGVVTGENKTIFMTVTSSSKPTSIHQWDGLNGTATDSVLITSSMPLTSVPSADFISEPEPIKFPTGENMQDEAYGYFYPPRNCSLSGMPGELPPLLVKAHGGPTSAASTEFNPAIQFWTSRGFAILDVDYRGSTGYGRSFRQKLNRQWGVSDVEDVVSGATYLVDRGSVDVKRLCIDGRSAGGLTTLGALAFKNTFTAGCSMYGIADLSVLAMETHKFESKYITSLIGKFPEEKEIFEARSPSGATDLLNCPVLLLHGDADKIVPPNQAKIMHEILLKKGIPTAIKIYEGEEHGFRRSENIQDALYSEFYFYAKVFGFEPAGNMPSLVIDNM